MKKLSIFLMAILAWGMIHAQEINFYNGTWQEANDLALQENKFIFVDAYTEWCGWCKVMDKEMFTDTLIYPYVNKHFIPIKIDFEDSLGVLLAMKFRVSGYPTTLVFNPWGQLVNKLPGYTPEHADYLKFLTEAVAVTEEKVFSYDSKELDLPYPEFFVLSYKKGKERKWPSDSIVTEYLESQDDLLSEINWSILFKFHPKSYDEYVIHNLGIYTERYGKAETSDYIYYLIYRKIKTAIDSTDRGILEEALSLCDKLEDPEKVRLNYLMMYYERTGDWINYIETLGSLIDLLGYDEHSLINNSCWTIYENVEDEALLKTAANWMKEVIDDQPTWMYLDTYAALLYKSGDLQKALKYADLAIEAGKNEEQKDITSTEELRKKIEEAINK